MACRRVLSSTPLLVRVRKLKDNFYEELESVFDKFPKFHINILLGDFSASAGREDIFKTTIGNESLQEISIDNGIRAVNFATSINPTVKSTMFLNRKIHKYTSVAFQPEK
jgi:hypothetical protein